MTAGAHPSHLEEWKLTRHLSQGQSADKTKSFLFSKVMFPGYTAQKELASKIRFGLRIGKLNEGCKSRRFIIWGSHYGGKARLFQPRGRWLCSTQILLSPLLGPTILAQPGRDVCPYWTPSLNFSRQDSSIPASSSDPYDTLNQGSPIRKICACFWGLEAQLIF